MIRFFDLSIKNKLLLIISFVSTVAFLLSVGIFYIYDKSQFKSETISDLEILARIIGDNNNANLLFNGTNEAAESLKTLIADKNIKQALLFKTNRKEPFAKYVTDTLNQINIHDQIISKDTSVFFTNDLLVCKPIYVNREKIGSIYIHYSLEEYKERIKQFTKIVLIILATSSLVIFLIALQLQKLISKPILSLSDLMKKVSAEKDYSLRSKKKGNDEIGILSEGFNQMLSQIEKSNKQLKEAKDYAVNSLKIKEQFLANMSHEIRTPMNAILGLTNLLLETELSNDQIEYLNNIKVSADNLLVIINDILDFSKIEAGKIEFEERDFNLFSTVEHLRDTLLLAANKKGLYLNTVIEDNVPEFVCGDEVRLSQVLMNLVGNAIKFTEEGGITVHIKKISDLPNAYEMQFSVFDTGIGIPKEKIDTIFASFSQASSSTTRKYGGTGLGLSISKQLVEHQGGSIKVTSEIGKGSTFTFALPLKRTLNKKTKEKDDKLTQLLDTYKQNYEPESIKVLLVEDNKMNQLLATTLLKKNQILIDVAEDGVQALEMHKSNIYDLILMDLHMPEMDGYDATKIIRSEFEGKRKTTPIIALTAAATKGEVEKCLTSGMTDFVSKPYKPNELLEKVLKLTVK